MLLLTLGLFARVAFAQPGNDNPCGAEVITPNASCVYATWSNVAATATAGVPAPACANYVGGDVWFQLIVPPGGSVIVNTDVVGGSALTDGGMAFYTAASCAGPFTLAGCDDDTGPGLMSQLSFTGAVGSTLWIRVWEYGNDAFGAFNICATQPPPPAANNDPCAFVPLTTNSTCVNTLGSNISATATAGIPAPACANYAGGDVWFRVVVPAGGTVTVTTDVAGGSPLTDSGLAFYTAASCAGPFTLVSCDDDSGPGLMSALTYTGTAGTVLWVRVWEYGNDTFGAFNICAIAPGAPPPPPTNNDPCGALTVTVASTCSYSTYTNVGATNSTTTPLPACGAFGTGSLDVWFRFVAPASGVAIIETQAGSMTDAAMALYTATACNGTFSLVSCDDDSGPGLMPFLSFTNLTPGATYYLRVWGFGAGSGTFGLCLHGPTSLPAGQCVWALQLFDSFGDGWGGSTVGVSINGGPFTNYTVTGSYDIFLLGVTTGQVIVVQYNATGPGQAENRFRLTFLSSGTTIYDSGTPPNPGVDYAQTVSCSPPPAPPNDCIGGITVCNGQAFNNNSNNTGNVADLNAGNEGCLSSAERQGTWYFFSPSASGIIGFTIAPVVPTDYDFALWGPMATIGCPPAAAPLRCSYSALYANTGLGNGAVDQSEGAGGDAWVQTINVIAGQKYILYIDNFSSNGQAFNLTWQLTNGASLNCTVLPIVLTSFTAEARDEVIDLHWTTSSEQDNDRFEIERSGDGVLFQPIGTVDGAGNSLHELHYSFTDRSPLNEVNYYRLKQVDLDGQYEFSSIVTAMHRGTDASLLLLPNPGWDQVRVVVPRYMVEGQLVVAEAAGRETRRVAITAGELLFDASALPTGVYSFRLISKAGGQLAQGTWIKK